MDTSKSLNPRRLVRQAIFCDHQTLSVLGFSKTVFLPANRGWRFLEVLMRRSAQGPGDDAGGGTVCTGDVQRQGAEENAWFGDGRRSGEVFN